MNVFETVIVTDYGTERVTGERAQIINRAPKRKDGQPDRRYKDAELVSFIVDAVTERLRAAH